MVVASPAAPLLAGAVVAAAGVADAEVRGLKKSASDGFAGVGVGVVEGAAAAFLRDLFLGAAAGDSAAEGDAAFSAGEAVGCAFLCVRCFAGEGDSVGDSLGAGD